MTPATTTSLHLLYGGTFDPVHLGHLAVARAALATTGAAHLDFVPAADPPHRGPPGAAFADRLDLLRAALASEPPPAVGTWAIDPREGARQGPSYTVDTLREWRAEHGEARPLGFVLGADAFLGLTGWHEWRALFDLAHLLVARRPGCALEGLPPALREALDGRWATEPADFHRAPSGRVAVLDLPLQPESATAVREAVAGRRPPFGLPAGVAAVIAARGLYRDPAPG
jgi:nicotinate-nucleotide adenylyltransferase